MKKFVSACAVILAAGLFFTGCGKAEAGYHYDNKDSYTAGDFTYDEESVRSVEINWIAGNVYIDESVMPELEVYEEAESELSDEDKLRYKIEDKTLIIQFCESGADISGKKKDLHVKLPILLDRLNINVVSADADIVSSAADIDYDTVSGDLYMFLDQCKNLDFNSVSGDAHLLMERDLGAKVDFVSVSGEFKGEEKEADNICEIDCNTVSGDLEVGTE